MAWLIVLTHIFKTINQAIADFLKICVKNRKNVVISGGTGSGKTTTLNILSSFIPDDERIVTIEDAAELQLSQEHVVRLESRPPNIEGKGEITIKTWVEHRKAHISISDTGAGILAKNLKNVFDPGFTTKGVGVGTGLGLSICYQIIQEHRGEIRVESEEGHGTTFIIVLPMNLDALLGES